MIAFRDSGWNYCDNRFILRATKFYPTSGQPTANCRSLGGFPLVLGQGDGSILLRSKYYSAKLLQKLNFLEAFLNYFANHYITFI